MRILHTLAQRPGRTGSGVFLQELFAAGYKKGYTQAVLAGIPQTQIESNIDNLDEKDFFPIYFESEDLPYPVVGMSDVMPYSSTKYSDIDEKMFTQYKSAFSLKIKEAVESFQPDIVISNHLWLMSSLIKELYPDLKVLCLCHGTDLRQAELSPNLFKIVKQNITKCDFVFALNEVQKQTILQKYGFEKEKVIVSGTGYDPSIFFQKPKPKTPPVKIVYVGKMSNAKGVPHLLNAYESLNYKKDEVSLTLIGGGTGSESENIQQKISSMKTDVKYLGFVEQKELVESFYNSHIFILPSFFEGLPLVIIEALACGMRVISTQLPGLKEFLGTSFEEIDAISYITLPRMKSIDKPEDAEVSNFENAIAQALKKQIQAVLEHKEIDKQVLAKNLEDKTWKGLFERLEIYI
jgi:glycosyltransferase involved in cell wall biosynthesis